MKKHMAVKLLKFTSDPERVISLAAGVCRGADDVSVDRVVACCEHSHMSVLEHASVTFRVDGISRACSHQLVRHRLASYCQQSQRHVEIDTEGDGWYVTPPSIMAAEGDRLLFKNVMREAASRYEQLLSRGIPAEDARYVLPQCVKTSLVVTMNYRELFHFFDLRLDSHAQWEIRQLASKMLELLSMASKFMHDLYLGIAEASH